MLASSRKPRPPGRYRADSMAVTACLVLLAVVLAALASQGTIALIVAGAVAFYVLMLALVGRERTAVFTLMAAFATAPMYKGLAPSASSLVTATDGLVALGVLLLAPSLFNKRIEVPGLFAFGVTVVFVMSSIASVASPEPAKSYLTMILWLGVMAGLPAVFAIWRPSDVVFDLLCWCYVFGHMVSFGYAMYYGPSNQGRYGGLATHPNYFAQGGLITFCVLLYLLYRHRTWLVRIVIVGAGAVCGATIYLSGSRAAMVVAAVLILMIPVVERSAIMGFLYAIGGALFVIAIPILVDISGETSSLGRLVGGSSSGFSDQARELGQQSGIERFLSQPFIGTGLIDLFEIHNMYLEIAAAIGVFGLAAYLCVIFVFARPLFSDVPHRRLLYVAWAFIGFGATVPGFYDRSIWLPLALGAVAVMEYRRTTPWFLSERPSGTPPTALAPAGAAPRKADR
ncbi:O-antigen ligase [Nocardioides sp. L-11A]|uniref:O-antigen ligase family protein n=1 Tax=Nocardioides sp. L-11A TaxID=3043848 RepID=UPI00249CE554|nr:O-antigen ligase family protein [Nocardioides sp. L-11A]